MIDWSYDAWPAVEPKWGVCAHRSEWDRIDFHVDLGCGTLKKARIGIDRYPAPGVNVAMNLNSGWVYSLPEAAGEDAPAPEHMPRNDWDTLDWQPRTLGRGLPFPDNSIESIISHHALEHIGEGFIPLIDEVYRVLKPDGIFRPITPLFPSRAAVQDPDHCRYFMEDTWQAFCGTPDAIWTESFSVPYTKARFEKLDEDITPPVPIDQAWSQTDVREIRVALRAVK